MSLIKCPDCGKDISNKSNACIYCGYQLSRKSEKKTKIKEKEIKQTLINENVIENKKSFLGCSKVILIIDLVILFIIGIASSVAVPITVRYQRYKELTYEMANFGEYSTDIIEKRLSELSDNYKDVYEIRKEYKELKNKLDSFSIPVFDSSISYKDISKCDNARKKLPELIQYSDSMRGTGWDITRWIDSRIVTFVYNVQWKDLEGHYFYWGSTDGTKMEIIDTDIPNNKNATKKFSYSVSMDFDSLEFEISCCNADESFIAYRLSSPSYLGDGTISIRAYCESLKRNYNLLYKLT